MRKIYLFTIALAVLMSFTSCGKSKISQIINDANLMIVNEEFDNALTLCDSLYENNLKKLSIEHKCDLSILYRDIYNKTKSVDVLNNCIDVYKSALGDDAKRVRAYIVETHDEYVYEDFEYLMEKQTNIAINKCLNKINGRLKKDTLDNLINSCDSLYERRYSDMNFQQRLKLCSYYYDVATKSEEGEIYDNAMEKSVIIYGDLVHNQDAVSEYMIGRYGFGGISVIYSLSLLYEGKKSGLI